MAKATSDAELAARLIERAADMKDRVEELPPSPDAVKPDSTANAD
jgi:hypothetical protein